MSKETTIKGNDCFNCLNHGEGTCEIGVGWRHNCKVGIENDGLKDATKCERYLPNKGFQIGGYYTHMAFEKEIGGDCLEWTIHSDGEFPTDDPDNMIQFHICDFEQIERWVEFWGKYLRKEGMIPKK